MFEHVFYTYFRFASISVPCCACMCVCVANGCVRAALAAVFAIAFCLCFMIMIVIIGMQTATASTMWQYWASGSPNNHLLCSCVCACVCVVYFIELWGHVRTKASHHFDSLRWKSANRLQNNKTINRKSHSWLTLGEIFSCVLQLGDRWWRSKFKWRNWFQPTFLTLNPSGNHSMHAAKQHER